MAQVSPHPEPLGAGWWLDEVKYLMLHGHQSVADAEALLEADLTCGVDLYRTQVKHGQPVMAGGLEVVRVICAHDDMRRWIESVRAEGCCRCPKHTEAALEEGLKRYASGVLVDGHPNPLGLNGRWEFKFFRGKQPMPGPRHGSIEFDARARGQELHG